METSKECVYSIAQVKEKYIESRELEGKAETGHLLNDWILPGTGMSDLSIPRSYSYNISQKYYVSTLIPKMRLKRILMVQKYEIW